MLKVISQLFLACIVILFHSCSISRKSMDSSMIKSIQRRSDLIKEMAHFAVEHTYLSDFKHFHVSQVSDRRTRKLLSSIANDVRVSYNERMDATIPDSIVSFSNLTLAGKTEIIYDFAARERSFPNDTSSRGNHYFIKVTDRIYYRRSLFPMM
jgi:hypothetical protein